MSRSATAPPSPSAFDAAGPVADMLLEVSWVLIGGTAAIFVLVMALLALAVRRARRNAPRAMPRAQARWWLYGGGLAFPAVVLVALFFYDERHRPAWRPVPPADALVIGITGHMWWWEVRYRDPASGAEIRTANEVRIPAGRPVYFGLTSADVIHSFWVPALGGKMDMLPGRVQHLLRRPTGPAPGAANAPSTVASSTRAWRCTWWPRNPRPSMPGSRRRRGRLAPT